MIIMWPCAKPRPAALCSRLATYRLNVIMFDQHTAALHIRVNHVLSIQIHSLCILVNILFHIIILQKKKKKLHLISGILLVFVQNYIPSVHDL